MDGNSKQLTFYGGCCAGFHRFFPIWISTVWFQQFPPGAVAMTSFPWKPSILGTFATLERHVNLQESEWPDIDERYLEGRRRHILEEHEKLAALNERWVFCPLRRCENWFIGKPRCHDMSCIVKHQNHAPKITSYNWGCLTVSPKKYRKNRTAWSFRRAAVLVVGAGFIGVEWVTELQPLGDGIFSIVVPTKKRSFKEKCFNKNWWKMGSKNGYCMPIMDKFWRGCFWLFSFTVVSLWSFDVLFSTSFSPSEGIFFLSCNWPSRLGISG